MTTVLADWHQGIMVSDSQVSDQDRHWCQRKVFRIRGALLGYAGLVSQAELFFAWYRGGCVEKAPKMDEISVLVMSPDGLLHYAFGPVPVCVGSGREAIGSGAKAAMVGYELMGWKDARRVVSVVCRHDVQSRAPVRVYQL